MYKMNLTSFKSATTGLLADLGCLFQYQFSVDCFAAGEFEGQKLTMALSKIGLEKLL